MEVAREIGISQAQVSRIEKGRAGKGEKQVLTSQPPHQAMLIQTAKRAAQAARFCWLAGTFTLW